MAILVNPTRGILFAHRAFDVALFKPLFFNKKKKRSVQVKKMQQPKLKHDHQTTSCNA